MIPIYFYIDEIKEGIPQISTFPYYMNNVINTEYQDGSIAPLREGCKYENIK